MRTQCERFTLKDFSRTSEEAENVLRAKLLSWGETEETKEEKEAENIWKWAQKKNRNKKKPILEEERNGVQKMQFVVK